MFVERYEFEAFVPLLLSPMMQIGKGRIRAKSSHNRVMDGRHSGSDDAPAGFAKQSNTVQP